MYDFYDFVLIVICKQSIFRQDCKYNTMLVETKQFKQQIVT